MILFLITDLYDLNNSRVLVEYINSKHPTTVYFLTTPLKPYRRVFLHYGKSLLKKVQMTSNVKKVCGSVDDLRNFVRKNNITHTFLNCSYYNQFEKIGTFSFKKRLGKLCMISWGFDGTSRKNEQAYKEAAAVFCEGPPFFNIEGKHIIDHYKGKIHFSHPYYDCFSKFTKEECRKLLGIDTTKKVLLIPETGNIRDIDDYWSKLYLEIVEQINRDEYYIIFKGRSKTLTNPCENIVEKLVDKYVEGEWNYPSGGVAASIAADICLMPCESKFALEGIFGNNHMILYSQNKWKGSRSSRLFCQIMPYITWEDFSKLKTGLNPDIPQKNLAEIRHAVRINPPSNCEYILRTLQL